jgi:NAD(P)-dependent dehydrogenase (short-subunit alcohol dehydrogenase family)
MSVVLITGSSSGIGHATAICLAKKGHKVYATMRDPSKALQPYILDGELLPIDVVQMDVNNDASVQKAVKQVMDREGWIDVLVNNAGISALGAIEELPLESFKKDMETNYFGTIRCIQAVLPSMRQRKKGTIINISSVAGKVYSNFHGTYAPTKAAVEALSECLAQEVVPHGIRVAVVEPGVTETPIFSKAYQLPEKTNYPNIKRFLSIFAASLENHTQPDGVAKVILDIIEGRSTTFRNPAGPDAIPLIEWRASQKDEDWIASTSIDDETWTVAMEEGMNLHVRTYMNDPSLINFAEQNKVVL